jgi:Glycosyl hydrolase family 3 N terminal domain
MSQSISMRAFLLGFTVAVAGDLSFAGDASADQSPAARLDAMVGQMFLLEFNADAARYIAAKGGDHHAAIADMLDLAAEFHLGGFVNEGGNDALYLDPDFGSVSRTATHDGLRLLVAVNEEGGEVQFPSNRWYDHQVEWIGCTSLGVIPGYRAENPPPETRWACPDHAWPADTTYLPFLRNAHLMGAMWTPAETETQARDIGRAMARLNITMDLAPVLGVSDGTDKASFLSDRTFADDPAKVGDWARAFSRGVRAGGGGRVVTVVKHFPGLGTAHDDTDDRATKTAPLAALEQRDLLPYSEPIDAYYGASAVMMSNAIVPGLTCPVDDPTCAVPATLSPDAYALLRGRYGWAGPITTDTLQTPAVLGSDRTMGEAVVSAIEAGADFVMFKPDDRRDDRPMSDYRAMLTEVRDAVLAWIAKDPEARTLRISQSIDRIRTLKASIAD